MSAHTDLHQPASALSMPKRDAPVGGPVRQQPAMKTATPRDEPPAADTPVPSDPTIELSGSIQAAWDRADALLLIASDVLDDLECTRIASENRLRSLTAPFDGKGGQGLPAEAPEVRQIALVVESLKVLEHEAELNLKRNLRKHPLGPWVKRTIGVGERQGGRLIAAIGNPAERRTVSQLWAYCGFHVLHPGHSTLDAQCSAARVDSSPGGGDAGQPAYEAQRTLAGVAPSRRKGQQANWSPTAKKRAHLVAVACMKKTASPYRPVYDAGREKYAESVHHHPCPQCGPAGKPAQPGSPLSAGHQHARALRLVAKEILKDLWIEARQLHQQ